MSSERLDRARAILSAALPLSPDQRAPYVAQQCASDEALRSEVEDLIALNDSLGAFLTTPLPELFGATIRQRRQLPGGTLLKNRYRIESILDGESGFASVYLAEDQLFAGKRMIVKVLDRIYDEAAIERAFHAEKQALSAVSHPNVVGVSDLGTLEDSTPFLVLIEFAASCRYASDDGIETPTVLPLGGQKVELLAKLDTGAAQDSRPNLPAMPGANHRFKAQTAIFHDEWPVS